MHLKKIPTVRRLRAALLALLVPAALIAQTPPYGTLNSFAFPRVGGGTLANVGEFINVRSFTDKDGVVRTLTAGDLTPGNAVAITQVLQAAIDLAKSQQSSVPQGRARFRVIYLPDGIYYVNASLRLGINSGDQRNSPFIRFVGQSQTGTVIRLLDNTAGFNAAATVPKAVLNFNDHGGNTSFGNSVCNLTVDTGASNPWAVALEHHANNGGYVEDVTLRSSDPARVGYAGLSINKDQAGLFQMKNATVVGFDYGVNVESNTDDNTGWAHCGLMMQDVTLSEQRTAGIRHRHRLLIVEKLNFTTATGKPALLSDAGPAGQAGGTNVIINSTLTNTGPTGAAAVQVTRGFLYARQLTTSGYTNALSGNTVAKDPVDDVAFTVAGPRVGEYLNSVAVTSPLVDTLGFALNLPARDLPEVAWPANPADWVIASNKIEAYRPATGAPTVDDPGFAAQPFQQLTTVAANGYDSWLPVWNDSRPNVPNRLWGTGAEIQAAIDSAAAAGKTTVVLRSKQYVLTDTISIHGSVRRVFGNWSRIFILAPGDPDFNPRVPGDTPIAGSPLNAGVNGVRQPVFRIENLNDATTPFIFEAFEGAFTPKNARFIWIQNTVPNPVVLRDLNFGRAPLYTNSDSAGNRLGTGDLFCENINTNNLSNLQSVEPLFDLNGQRMWARCFDMENFPTLDAQGTRDSTTGPTLRVRGGAQAWIAGAKFGEHSGAFVHVSDQSRAEILGVVFNQTTDWDIAAPLVINDNSDVTVVGHKRNDSNSAATAGPSAPVREIYGALTADIPFGSFVSRRSSFPSGSGYIITNAIAIPLYRGQLSAPLVQVGTVTTPNNSTGWNTVTFPQPLNQPVVLAGLPGNNDTSPVTVQVQNITRTNFQYRLIDWDSSSAPHGSESLSWLALDAGFYRYGGRRLFAGTESGVRKSPVTTETLPGGAWGAGFGAFTGWVEEPNNNGVSSFRVQNAFPLGTGGTFDVMVQNPASGTPSQRVNYVALGAGTGIADGLAFEVSTEALTGTTAKTLTFATAGGLAQPSIFGQVVTNADTQAVGLRNNSVPTSTTQAIVRLQEHDNSSHGNETAAILAIDRKTRAPLDKQIYLQANSGSRRAVAQTGAEDRLLATATNFSPGARYTVVAATFPRIALLCEAGGSVTGNYVRANQGATGDSILRADRTGIGNQEQYEWINNSDGTVSLRALNKGSSSAWQTWVIVLADGTLSATGGTGATAPANSKFVVYEK